MYTIGSAVGVIALVQQPGAMAQKVAAGAGVLHVVAAHLGLHRIYSAAGQYDAIFKEAMIKEQRALEAGSAPVESRGA